MDIMEYVKRIIVIYNVVNFVVFENNIGIYVFDIC